MPYKKEMKQVFIDDRMNEEILKFCKAYRISRSAFIRLSCREKLKREENEGN